ncbi:hypothetical protein Tco_1324594 [Tanacetum coccineum]
MILGTDLHCFDVHNDGYFSNLPLSYVDGVICEMVVRRMPYEEFEVYLEEKCGYYFQGLYYQVPSQDLERGLVRVSDDSQAITYDKDACVSKTICPPKKRYYNDFSLDEIVDWAEMEVEKPEGVKARTSTTKVDATDGVDATDKGKEKVSQDATEVVQTRRSIVEIADSDYQPDKSADYLSPGEEELIELKNKMKANREAKAKAKDNPVSETNKLNNENSMPANNDRCETFEEHDIYMNKLLKSLNTADKDGITKDPIISVKKHVERLVKSMSGELRVVAKCEQRPPRLSDPEKGKQRKQTNRGNGLTLMSDQHKGLIEAVKRVMPNAELKQCARHIYDKIKSGNPNSHKYLVDKNSKTWSRAFFKVNKGSEAIENGFSECFNSVIVNVRHKPLLTMLEAIRVIVLERMNKMKEIKRKWNPRACPNIKKRLEWLKEQQRFWHVIPAGGNLFEVRSGSEGFTVDEGKRTCSYRMWQLSGIPCVHATKRGLVRDEGADGSRGGARESRGRGGAVGSRCGASGSRGGASVSRGVVDGSRGGRGVGGSGCASGSRGRGAGGSGGASGSRGRGACGSKRKPVSTAGTQKRQGTKKIQDEDQVEQTQEQTEIDLTQVEQNPEQAQDQVHPQEQPQQAALRMPSARILQRKLGKQGSSH